MSFPLRTVRWIWLFIKTCSVHYLAKINLFSEFAFTFMVNPTLLHRFHLDQLILLLLRKDKMEVHKFLHKA